MKNVSCYKWKIAGKQTKNFVSECFADAFHTNIKWLFQIMLIVFIYYVNEAAVSIKKLFAVAH